MPSAMRCRVLRVAHRQHHDELVAADARDGVGLAHAVFQACRDLFQHLVARFVAMGIVDRLEAVEVEQHDRHVIARATRCSERLRNPVVEEPAIRQAGQLVVVRQRAHFLLAPLALGDVGIHPDRSLLPVVRIEMRPATWHPEPLAVLADEFLLELVGSPRSTVA
jgi:hypothetical protein